MPSPILFETSPQCPYGHLVIKHDDSIGVGYDTQDHVAVMIVARGLGEPERAVMREVITQTLLALRLHPAHHQVTPWTHKTAPACTLHTAILLPGVGSEHGWHAQRD